MDFETHDRNLIDELQSEKEELEAEITALRARLAEVEGALKPFAAMVPHLTHLPDNENIYTRFVEARHWVHITVGDLRRAALASSGEVEGVRTFRFGDRVTKIKGSKWTGRVVGTYSTSLTPEGYAVESETEVGSVQIYPVAALASAGEVPERAILDPAIAPGHTDLMVDPESIDDFMVRNPLPGEVGFHTPMPNPTPADLEDATFNAIWNVIKTWDVNVPAYYGGYCGAHGSHVMLILDALRSVPVPELAIPSPTGEAQDDE